MIVYLFLVLILRVFGKRELAQLNPFDLVVLLSLSRRSQNAIIGKRNLPDRRPDRRLHASRCQLPGSAVPVPAPAAGRIFRGEADGPRENGRIVKSALARELMSRSELLTVLAGLRRS